ncbi:Carboxylesterase [Oesophagostomum dentatum]|uniref:Carboxylesterase n=1 Tax=Oesophagostomum dentatum TaxID=61180 RepID=A0A0B1T473_OESDE|nr:Carboxylesterase [Oesophagostomum dentatum]
MLSRLAFFSWWVVLGSAQHLKLAPGEVHGFNYETKTGHYAEVFLNIPYASPPVGELRLEKTQPVKPWRSARNGTEFGPICHQLARELMPKGANASEDCLTLNLIRPKKEEIPFQPPEHGFPILFWVHGGGYEVGSALQFGYKTYADIYIPNDIIVVIIQYRLNIYGFFSIGDDTLPGNLGLFDMAEALKFIHSNAENIGGNASRITVWGESAGGCAAGQLVLSPITRKMALSCIAPLK